jgi:hypothetical protein
MSPLDYALAYARLGWHVFPVEAGTKQPLGRLAPQGFLDASTDPATLRGWWSTAPDASIGVAMAASNLVAIDIDPRNGGLYTMEQLEAEHGALDSSLLAFTGGGGEHRVFSLSADTAAGLPGKLGPGVDIKWNGYILVEPSLHPSGKSYQWEASSSPLDGIAPTPLPDWIRGHTRIAGTRNRVDRSGAWVPVTDSQWAELESALQRLPSDDRDQWVRVGMALHSTGELQRAYDLWCRWSQQSPKFDPRDQLRVWRSFKAEGLAGTTYRTIFSMAQPEASAVALVADRPFPDLPIVYGEDIKVTEVRIRQIVEDMLTEGGLSVMYGESNSGKSFLATHLACAIGRGMDWLGYRTVRGPVVYVAGEGSESIKLRIAAHVGHYKAKHVGVAVVPVAINMLDSNADALRVVRAVEAVSEHYGEPVKMVVIDTLARAIGGGNENAGEDMGAVIKHADLIREKSGAHVMFIHHSGKDATKGSRGHSSLKAATDTEIEVTADEATKLHTAEITKQRDLSSKGKTVTGKFVVIAVGKDQWGKQMTTCVVESTVEVAQSASQKRGRKPGHGSLQDAIVVALKARGHGMSKSELATLLVDQGAGSSIQSVYNAIKSAQMAGRVSEELHGRITWTGGL